MEYNNPPCGMKQRLQVGETILTYTVHNNGNLVKPMWNVCIGKTRTNIISIHNVLHEIICQVVIKILSRLPFVVCILQYFVRDMSKVRCLQLCYPANTSISAFHFDKPHKLNVCRQTENLVSNSFSSHVSKT